MKTLLLIVVLLATASAQTPSFLFGTTSQIIEAPAPVIRPISGDVDGPQHEISFARSPQFYAADDEKEENQVEPGFPAPIDQANQYASSGVESPLINVIVPPAFVEGQVPLAVSPVLSQYQTQYVDGRYNFGYAGGPNSRTETRDASGKVRGAYIYVDGYGNVQSRRYVADEQGFRAVGSDIPKATFELEDTPEVKEAKEALRKAYEQAATRLRRSI